MKNNITITITHDEALACVYALKELANLRQEQSLEARTVAARNANHSEAHELRHLAGRISASVAPAQKEQT